MEPEDWDLTHDLRDAPARHDDDSELELERLAELWSGSRAPLPIRRGANGELAAPQNPIVTRIREFHNEMKAFLVDAQQGTLSAFDRNPDMIPMILPSFIEFMDVYTRVLRERASIAGGVFERIILPAAVLSSDEAVEKFIAILSRHEAAEPISASFEAVEAERRAGSTPSHEELLERESAKRAAMLEFYREQELQEEKEKAQRAESKATPVSPYKRKAEEPLAEDGERTRTPQAETAGAPEETQTRPPKKAKKATAAAAGDDAASTSAAAATTTTATASSTDVAATPKRGKAATRTQRLAPKA